MKARSLILIIVGVVIKSIVLFFFVFFLEGHDHSVKIVGVMETVNFLPKMNSELSIVSRSSSSFT